MISSKPPPHRAAPELNLDVHGEPLSYKSETVAGNFDLPAWLQGAAEEIIRLLISGTLVPIHHHQVPHDRRKEVVYYNPMVKQKRNPDNSIKFRVRGTAGGDRLTVPYDVTAQTAGLDDIKLLIHSTVSARKKWRTLGIADFYLGTPLPASRYEYM
jgi:hypothetical protein